MPLSAYFKKASLALTLARGSKTTLGNKTYRLKGFYVNTLALKGKIEPSEPWLDAVYRTVLQCREGAFLDVGANVGQTMFKILALDSSRQYLGFEPQVPCCFLIQRFLEENHITKYAIFPVGLSNTNGTVKLYLRDGDYDTTASTVKDFRPESFYTAHRYICLRHGDELVSELGVTSVSTIKIDVEGAELEVIEGLLDVIEAKRPFLIFEVLNHFLVVSGETLDAQHVRFRESRIEKMEDILRKRDYEIFNIQPGNCLAKVRKIAPPTTADLSATNYIAVSKVDLDSFLRVFPGTVVDS